MARSNLNKNLERSLVPGSIIQTDSNNKAYYTPPGVEGSIPMIVNGIVVYVEFDALEAISIAAPMDCTKLTF